jgi:hypothetical protein
MYVAKAYGSVVLSEESLPANSRDVVFREKVGANE